MPFSPAKRKDTLSGIVFVAIFAAAATMIADLSLIKNLGISPLVVGIVLGIFYANTLHSKTPTGWEGGITFSGKKILRFAIVFYGFRITFQQIAEVGMEGFMVSLIMLSSTFILGTYLGQKIFKMEKTEKFTFLKIREAKLTENKNIYVVEGYATTWNNEYPVFDWIEDFGYIGFYESFERIKYFMQLNRVVQCLQYLLFVVFYMFYDSS